MMQGISGAPMSPPPARTDQSLSQTQQDTIAETLSRFDADNVSQSDASSIVEAFTDAGITPGASLEKIMAEYGFDAKSIGELANVNKTQAESSTAIERDVKSMLEYMTELMEEALAASSSDALSDEQETEIYNQVLDTFGLKEYDTILNTSA